VQPEFTIFDEIAHESRMTIVRAYATAFASFRADARLKALTHKQIAALANATA